MSTQRTEVFVGGAVLALTIGFAIFVMQSTGLRDSGDHYALSASFRSAEGVSIGTDVRLAGVRIGSVSSVELDPVTYRANTELLLSNDIEIPEDSAVVVSSEGLLGGSFVEIIPGGSPFALEQGGEIEDTQGAVSLINLLLKFATGGD